MATAGGLVSRSTWQGLLRRAARPRARPSLLGRQPRWMSSEEQARSDQLPTASPDLVGKKDQWLLTALGEPIKSIDQKSFVECEEPVRLIGSSKIKCLCSWNEASGSRQAIFVPGNASRPREKPLPPSDATTYEALVSASKTVFIGYCRPGRGPRDVAWDDSLAALYATEPELRLHDADVMIMDHILHYLLLIAQNSRRNLFKSNFGGIAFNMSLIGNTLVIKERVLNQLSQRPVDGVIQVPSAIPSMWEHYKVATELAPEVEDSSVHHQLLRYKLGPLSCLVRTRAHGTVQEMPASKGPSAPPPPPARDIHGIDVIKAGKGIRPNAAFHGTVWRRERSAKDKVKTMKTYMPRLWFAGQSRLGIADIIPAGNSGGDGLLKIERVRGWVKQFEKDNQHGLQRLVGLLAALRDTVRAHGAPCTGVICPTTAAASPATPEAKGAAKKKGEAEKNWAIHVHAAGPDEEPALLDWHKEHFWHQKAHNEQVRPEEEGARNEHSQPKEDANEEDVQPQQSTNSKIDGLSGAAAIRPRPRKVDRWPRRVKSGVKQW